MNRILPLLLIIGWYHTVYCQGNDQCRIAFWNVENFFDTQHDTLKEDYAFTPSGENHWTYKRYTNKRNNIYKTIAALKWPAIIGLAEVENDQVLRDLCKGTPLRKFNYAFIHYDSPDARGVDCALLYRTNQFCVLESKAISISDSANGFYSRDILMVFGKLTNRNHDDTCYIFVNHWPSKLGGATADIHRMRIAEILLETMDSVWKRNPRALVIAMGDFNANKEEESISKGMQFYGHQCNQKGFYNLTYTIPKEIGSYKYQGKWSCIDQMFANRNLPLEIFHPDWMLSEDTKYMDKKPFRTYVGMKYLGGYSDHLPIIITLQ